MAKSKDNEIILLSNNDSHTVMLTDLRNVNIKDISKQKNNRMSAYLNLLVDDIYLFRGDYKLNIEISISDMNMSITLDSSYPYYYDTIFLYFDLKVKASQAALAKALSDIDTDDSYAWGSKDQVNLYLDCSIGEEHELMLSDYSPMYIDYGRQLLRNVKLIDQALYFDNNLVTAFYQNTILTEDTIMVKNSSFKFLIRGADNSLPVIKLESPFLFITINHTHIEIHFNNLNIFNFSTSANFERDLNMTQMFIRTFIEKDKDHDIQDLKSELLLLDMAVI